MHVVAKLLTQVAQGFLCIGEGIAFRFPFQQALQKERVVSRLKLKNFTEIGGPKNKVLLLPLPLLCRKDSPRC